MTNELYKKLVDYIDDEKYTIGELVSMSDIISWFFNVIWHDINEVPKFIEGDNTANQIIVFGETETGKGCSICSMVGEGIIYAPISGMTYKWGNCPFKKWAYVKDILTAEIYKS